MNKKIDNFISDFKDGIDNRKIKPRIKFKDDVWLSDLKHKNSTWLGVDIGLKDSTYINIGTAIEPELYKSFVFNNTIRVEYIVKYMGEHTVVEYNARYFNNNKYNNIFIDRFTIDEYYVRTMETIEELIKDRLEQRIGSFIW